MPKAFTEYEKQRIREQLLAQGNRQFSTYGLKKTSIEELAQAAGISKAAFYLFYPSKESLFMDVVELAEQQFRQEVLAVVEQTGPSPRTRLVAVLKKAFSLWKTIPILQFFTRSDYEQLARRLPQEQLQEHLSADQQFMEDLAARCQAAGIPIQVAPEQMSALMYPLFFAVLHENDFGPQRLTASILVLIELVAAYCLGEVVIDPQPVQPVSLSKDQ
jgi:AcrR family transcriptional regulator